MDSDGQLTLDDALIEEGLCYCGCGGIPAIASQTRTRWGHVQGKPVKYIQGHQHIGRRGSQSGHYKDGRSTTHHGYTIVRIDSASPYFSMAKVDASGNTGYVKEHRLVMAEYIGRPLREEEVVHHENEDRTDNSISNLRLFHSKGAHTRYHAAKRRAERQASDTAPA